MTNPAKPAAQVETADEKIRRLESELAEKAALISAQAQTIEQQEAERTAALMFGATMQEVSCGTRKVEKMDAKGEVVLKKQAKLDGEGEPMIDLETGKTVFEYVPIMVDAPVFKYKIELPPSAGLSILINSTPLFHGNVYEFTAEELRTIKDIVARAWAHEQNIMGRGNENAYRPQTNATFSMRTGQRTH